MVDTHGQIAGPGLESLVVAKKICPKTGLTLEILDDWIFGRHILVLTFSVNIGHFAA